MVGSTFAIEVLSSGSHYGVETTTVIKLQQHGFYKAQKAFTRCMGSDTNGHEEFMLPGHMLRQKAPFLRSILGHSPIHDSVN